ncbi:MAG TPA: phosphatidate cytidylyltransferase [Acidimicrobiales bacterium]|nr:phosphatidate cytidylyltransferase [Acidimicrobiales bacterium]
MADHEDDRSTQPPRTPGEGIRIIGAEEAAAAVEGPGARRGAGPARADVPPPPPGRAPTLRFPLEGEPEEAPAPPTELPHWTEPPTGEVPRVSDGPRWRDSGEDWEEAPPIMDDEEPRLGALDTSRPDVPDLYDFDEPAPTPIRTRATPGDTPGDAPRRGMPRPAGRENTRAIAIGVGLAAVFLLFAALGPKYLLVMAAIVVAALVVELYAVLRRAGYKPATLLGLVATVALMFGVYWKGERAIPLVTVLVVVFSFLWYLAGVVHARPTVNIAATIMVFAWGGLLGSYAGLLLRPPTAAGHGRDGVAFLLAAVLLTVVNDVIAYVGGQAFGRTPLAPAVSPHKTWEGFALAFVATALCGAGIIGQIHPFTVKRGLALGLVIGVVAPLGDLSESLIKRDIGVKDMGSTLPGHGGLADRFDALLFALPATYYLLQFMKVV